MKISFVYTAIGGKTLAALILFGALLLGGCQEEKKAPTRMEQVMAIHDSVMPEMSTISRLVGRLKPLADSTESGQPYRKAMEDLQDAHSSMMAWMKGFGDRFDHAEIIEGKELSAEKQEWLKEEEVKVKEMAEKVNLSIARARDLLDKTETQED